MTAMMTTSPIDEAERARRTEWMRDLRAATAQHESLESRTTRREQMADDWSRWFHHRMDATGLADPVQLLPDACARLQQQAEDRIAAAVEELKATLRGALK
jgi:hypothetical protein